jgi:hypothetical protein
MRTPPYNVPYHGPDHKIRCAVCSIGMLRSRAVFMVVDAPGYPRKQLLVHPECFDKPQPRAIRPVPPAPQPPDVIQEMTITEPTYSAMTLTSATTPISAGVATTITLTGTNFHDSMVGRVDGQSRPTTYVSSTSMTMTVYAADAVSGRTLKVDVFTFRVPDGTSETPAAIQAANHTSAVNVVVS